MSSCREVTSEKCTQPTDPPLLQKRTLHTVVPLATGVVHPSSCRLTTAQRHGRQLLEITAELHNVAAKTRRGHFNHQHVSQGILQKCKNVNKRNKVLYK